MSEPTNYGYSGLAVTLPHVIDNVGNRVYTLGRLLRSESGSERIWNRETNNEKYYDQGAALTLVKNKIEDLFNHACIVGHQALRLLETMWCYCHRVEQDEPDETAWRLARDCWHTWDHDT